MAEPTLTWKQYEMGRSALMGNKRHLVGKTSHIYTKRLPARGRSFTHQTLVREYVLSARQIRYRSTKGEYVGSYTLDADMLHIAEHPSASGHPVAASTSVLASLIQAPSVCLTHTHLLTQHSIHALRHDLYFRGDVTPSRDFHFSLKLMQNV